jgi:hypothetical protein
MNLIFCHLAKQRWLDEVFLLSLELDGLSPFKLDGILDASDLAKQRWLDEELVLSLKLDGLSPFKLDRIADDCWTKLRMMDRQVPLVTPVLNAAPLFDDSPLWGL